MATPRAIVSHGTSMEEEEREEREEREEGEEEEEEVLVGSVEREVWDL